MKKIISLFIALITVFALCTGTAVSAASGDVNSDGELNNKDVVILFRYVSAGTSDKYDPLYDYNNDNEVNNKDVVALFRALSVVETPATEVRKINIGGVPIENFTVVTAAEPLSAENNAAVELIRLVEFEYGVTLPRKTDSEQTQNAIILGVTKRDTQKLKTARTKVKDDGYALIEDNGNLYISGTIGRGTRNGVYEFLQEYLGIRFYSDTFTYIRKDGIKDVPKGTEKVDNPSFGGRYNWSFAAESNVQNFPKRTNSTSIKYAGSHNLGSYSKTGDGTSAQPCLSDPAVFEQVFKSVCKQIEKNPNKTFFHINQNDGGSFCNCADCTAKNQAAGGTCMGSLLMFINEIADAVKEKYPDREIDIMTYAYKETTIMPDPDVVKPRDNVIIVLCMMDSSCFAHAYNDPNCEHNKKAYENMVNWSKVCNKFAVYDYSYNHASQISSVGPNLDVLWDNMQAFQACGCIGLLFEGDHVAEAGEFAELRNYLINRLMWNCDITKEEYYQMWNEFMEDYYGAAAPFIREYIDLLNATSLRPGLTDWNGHTSVYTDPSVFYAPKVDGFNSYTVINKCIELWDKALACDLTDEQFAHVEKSSLHFRDFESRYAMTSSTKTAAAEEFKALCDKYTYNYDGKLLPPGKTDGISTTKASDGLEYRTYPNSSKTYVSDQGDFTDGLLVVPSSYNGKKVVAVGKSAFARANNLKEVHISEGITTIGVYAFRGCNNLSKIYLPKSLTYIGYGAFGITGNEHFECRILSDIYYAGTSDMWHKLYDRSNGDWNALSGVTIHCSDKDIIITAE